MTTYEKLGAFYLGRPHDLKAGEDGDGLVLYDSKDLVTHAVCVGMTGSGKTGLCVGLLEEAAIDGIPAIVIDPKGDLGNLLLTFPDLRPEDFRPWINEDDARRKGLEPDAYAAAQADLWRGGLASWGQDGERIRSLRESADFAISPPGSDAGLPVSILASFAAPTDAEISDEDAFRDRVATTTTSLLGLLGVDADPIRSREHILLSNILDRFWREGRDVDLAGLIHAIQEPPFKRVGGLDLESFYPSKDRFELAMMLNNLLAAPGFQSWMEGEALDLDRLLYTETGKPRVAVFSISHLGESERMFFVSLLLNQTLGWMRSRPGTTSLRALLYMDEIFGFMPPVAEPPSKKPLLTMLKQARAYGLGVVLATQNPVDLDYKGLSNTGTWFIGRLQTERDKARVLDGLEGATPGEGFDRGEIDRILSGLGKRVFLLHNVHEDGPEIFRTRWAMSYLRGPLTRDQIRQLMDDRRSGVEEEPRTEVESPSAGAPERPVVRPAATVSSAAARPVLDSGVTQVFLPGEVDEGAGIAWEPGLLGLARVHFFDRSSRRNLMTEELALVLPLHEEMLDVDWSEGRFLDVTEADLEQEPGAEGEWLPLPASAGKKTSYRSWSRELASHLYRSRGLELLTSPRFKLTSEPGESERDFRIRMADLAREERDAAAEKLRKKHASKARTLEDRIRRARQKIEKEKEEASQEKLNTMISLGATLLSAFTGRKKLSASTLGRATTALRGAGRSSGRGGDVERAEESAEALVEELTELNRELEEAVEELDDRFDAQAEELEIRTIRPRKTDVEVKLVALAWTPVK